MDYVLNVYKNEEFLFAIGGKHMNYDNVIWWQLEELLKVVKSNKGSKEELLKEIQSKATYFRFVFDKVYEGEPSIDIEREVIDMPYMPLYEFEEVDGIDCIIKLVKKEDGYYAEYDDGEQFKMEYVEFEEELLRKERVSFEEFLKVSNFMNSIQDLENDTDFILNNKLVLRLNSI